MRWVDASVYAETMRELEQNAKRAILKHKFGNNSSYRRFVLEQGAEKIPLFFCFFKNYFCLR